ncbi:MAG: AsmA family protein [Burkholderiales bacterium]|nr:AsmA family protein [Burkholderiales bacterium]
MRLLKYVLLAVAAVVVLLIVAAAILAATFDPNDYRPRIVELVKERTGRDIAIGDIGLKLFPKVGARLEKVSLAERDGSGEFAGVDAAEVYVALLPLLSRDVVVDQVRIQGVRAKLLKRADGSTNFDDLLRPGEPSAEPSEPTQPGRPIHFDVQGIHVSDAQVSWQDATTGNDVTVNLSELRTGRVVEKQPVDVHLAAAVQGAQPRLDARTRVDGTLDFDLQTQRFRFAGMETTLEGSALDFTDIAVSVKGDIESMGDTGRVAVSGLHLQGKARRGGDAYSVELTAPAVESSPQALQVEQLKLSASGTIAGMQLDSSTVQAPGLRLNLADSRVLIDGLTVTAQGRIEDDAVRLDLRAPRLDLTPEQASGESAEITATLKGPRRNGDVNLRLAGVQGNAKALRVAALSLAVDLRQQDDAIKGELSTPVAGNLESKVFELEKLAGRFTVTSPAMPQKTVQVPIDGSARADLGKERVSMDLVTRFDESNIKAKAGMTGFGKPAYDFDVAIDALNVDRYLPPEPSPAAGKQPQAGAGSAAKQPGAAKEDPIDLSALKPLDLRGTLRVGRLQASKVKAVNVRVDVRAKDGRLSVDPLGANLYQGSVKGSATIDANANRFAIRQTLSGVQIGPLLRDAADKNVLEGRGTVVLDLVTHGARVDDLKRALNGTARIELRDGAVKGVDLAGAVRRVKSLFNAGDVEGSGSAKDKTDFSELTASFVVRNGVAHNEDLDLKSPFLRVTGSGDVNIPQNAMNYVVKTSVVASMTGQGGADRPELKGLTVPVRVSGPFDALKYEVEFSQMVRGATKERLDAAKQAGREAVEGAAREKLQELLGGKQEQKPDDAAGGEQTQQAAPKRPQDQLKDTLRGLLR